MFARVILPLLALGLLIYALLDIAGTEKKDLGGVPKWFWVVIVIVLPVLGPLLWIVFRASRKRSEQSYGSGPSWGPAGRPGRGARRPSGPVAPDDDPDFLWRLEQERRRQQRNEAGGAAGGSAESNGSGGSGSGESSNEDDTDGSPTDKGGPAAS
jgi:hypothetical protein